MRALCLMGGLLVLLTAACGDGRTETSLAGTIEFGELPEFRSFSTFPGEVSGLGMNITGAPLLQNNAICLTVEEAILGEPLLNGLPVNLVMDRRVLSRADIDVQRNLDEGTLTYCIAPYLQPGSHTLDVDVNTTDGLEVYQVIFDSERISGWRPLSNYPGSFSGMTQIDGGGDVYVLEDDFLCIGTNRRVIPASADMVDLVRVTVDGETLPLESLITETQAGVVDSCFIMEFAPGEYRIEMVLTALDSIVTELTQVTAEEWYAGTLRVEAGS